jgi:hypothetical protein
VKAAPLFDPARVTGRVGRVKISVQPSTAVRCLCSAPGARRPRGRRGAWARGRLAGPRSRCASRSTPRSRSWLAPRRVEAEAGPSRPESDPTRRCLGLGSALDGAVQAPAVGGGELGGGDEQYRDGVEAVVGMVYDGALGAAGGRSRAGRDLGPPSRPPEERKIGFIRIFPFARRTVNARTDADGSSIRLLSEAHGGRGGLADPRPSGSVYLRRHAEAERGLQSLAEPSPPTSVRSQKQATMEGCRRSMLRSNG